MIHQDSDKPVINGAWVKELERAIHNFVAWLDRYGETSFDHQSFYAGGLGGKAKALYYRRPLIGTIAVAPMVLCEAFMPSARGFFWRKQRFPIADAHYAMGFSYLSRTLKEPAYYRRALHFLDVLETTRCRDYSRHCWGYPFDWTTRSGTIPTGTPLITTTPYAYEAFSEVSKTDGSSRWLETMRSIAEHAASDIKDFEAGPNSRSCSYTPYNGGGVINASAYRAFVLTNASVDFSEQGYWRIAEKNLNFVLQNQRDDGSWYYSVDGTRDFVDNFHTCFVLKALAKIERLTGHVGCRQAIGRGLRYYVDHLLDERGLPKPFSRAPRFTVYRQELYDYAECINLGVLLKGRLPEFDTKVLGVLRDLLTRWQKHDGSFRSRRLLVGWDNVPMHRWAQSQIFRSLSFLLSETC